MRNWERYSLWLGSLVAIVLILGIFFRFVNLERKIYWNDETYTSLRISGYTEKEVVQEIFTGQVISIKSLHKYQRLNPEKNLFDTVKGLALEEPQHPPLYFIMIRFWVQWFGNSVAVIRSLSALLSLLAFPCIYWLCLELFNSPLTGWIAMALIAVSPFHVLYAQEAREYSLWTVTTLLSSASLLWAMRLSGNANYRVSTWGMYAATIALSLYTYLLSALVIIGHGIYVVVTERFQLSKRVIAYLLASLAGFFAFAPWIAIVIINSSSVNTTTSWLTKKKSLTSLVLGWVHNFKLAFFDLNIEHPFLGIKPDHVLTASILALVGYSLYFLWSNNQKTILLFILTLSGVTASALVLPDLASGGERSLVLRYLTPFYLGIQLAVAHLIASQIVRASFFQQKIWQAIMAVLISCGIVSCAILSQAETSWNKAHNHDPKVVHLINQTPKPLLMCDATADLGGLVSLSYLLDPKVRLWLLPKIPDATPNLPKLPDGFSDLFLFDPSNGLRDGLDKEHNYKVEPVYRQTPHNNDKIWFWRLEKK